MGSACYTAKMDLTSPLSAFCLHSEFGGFNCKAERKKTGGYPALWPLKSKGRDWGLWKYTFSPLQHPQVCSAVP